MKILTVAIPCYNSMDYMSKAINSLLSCKEDIEIIIVNDGSTDKTEEIGKKYADEFPDTVKYIYQENGGHGEGVNTGLRNATGLYYKVLDSDDWFDEEALKKVIETLKKLNEENKLVDMLISNYVYEKPSVNKTKVIKYTNALPVNRIFGWDETKHFYTAQNLLMHSLTYRTEVLRESKMILPKHTFYVDELFAYVPLPYVKTMYYLNVDLYRYYIGRADQSVNEKIMISRIDQQIKVNKLMMDNLGTAKLENNKLRKYMLKYLIMILSVSTSLLIKSGTKENLKKHEELINYLKKNYPNLYKTISKTFIGFFIKKASPIRRKIVMLVYNISQKIYIFN